MRGERCLDLLSGAERRGDEVWTCQNSTVSGSAPWWWGRPVEEKLPPDFSILTDGNMPGATHTHTHTQTNRGEKHHDAAHQIHQNKQSLHSLPLPLLSKQLLKEKHFKFKTSLWIHWQLMAMQVPGHRHVVSSIHMCWGLKLS